MEGARGDEADIEGRRGGRHHSERVLHAHEEQEPQCEEARHPVVSGDVDGVMHRPRHERGLAAAVVLVVAVAVDDEFHGDTGLGAVFGRSFVAPRTEGRNGAVHNAGWAGVRVIFWGKREAGFRAGRGVWMIYYYYWNDENMK